MIQLQYSSTGISNKPVWVDTKYTGSLLRLSLTSSFTGDVTNINVDVISNKSTDIGGWLLYEVDKNKIPTDSGQYSANIYEAEAGGSPEWIYAQDTWTSEDETWIDYAGGVVIGSLLSQDRALISGSDYDTTYKYEFEEESNFTVYNG